ncbi:MAG: rhomboid family intramembrane serine protease [Armatimonadetes bacterium]|nr:rhomboid family intramembrane serine protease [Armatimonadota bacterium]
MMQRPFDIRDLFAPPTPAVKWLIISMTAVFALEYFPATGPLLNEYFVLRPQEVLQGRVWQLATYMWLHSTGSPLHILFNLLALWWFGSSVEGNWGTKRFIQYFMLCGVGAGLASLIAPYPVIGCSGAVLGIMVAYALLFPDDTVIFFVFPMKAPTLVILLIAIDVLQMLGGPTPTAVVTHLAGAAIGFVYVKYSWRMGIWWKQRAAPPITGLREPARRAVSKGKARGSEPTPITAARSHEYAVRPQASAEEIALQKRADEILDKISREGMGSLNEEERGILQRQSQILRSREGGVVNLDDYRS